LIKEWGYLGTIILTDSGCDLPLEYVEQNKDILDVLGMPVNIDGYEYYDDFGKTFSHDDFYSKLRSGILPSTAQINLYRFTEKFTKHYENGTSIIYLGLCSGLSGTYNNAVLAREEFLQEHPNADITVIDPVSASIGQGLLIVYAVNMVRKGKSKEDIVNWIEENKMNIQHWFGVDDLHYLKKGGRISATTAVLGTALNVKPILIVNHEGKLTTYTNVRGRKKSIKFLSQKFNEHMTHPENTLVIIGHGNCPDDAEKLKEFILDQCTPKQIIVSELSATIASHVGPNMIAITFLGDIREDK
jgi:DegV family protein with EDD domain